MKKQCFFLLLFFTFLIGEAQVAINENGADPNSNAILDVSSTTKGMLIPRMTTSQRTDLNTVNAIGTSEDGLIVYDTDTKSFWYWDGTSWNDMGNSSSNEDKDWLKQGTTDAPTDISDSMFHTGNVAIGKNTADTKLDVFQDSDATSVKVDNANPDNSVAQRAGAFVNVGGTASTKKGKIAVNASVGGDPGDAGGSYLIGVEADVAGADGVDKGQFGFISDVGGNNDGFHIGTTNYMHGNGDGIKYGTFNNMSTSGNGIVYSTYDYITDSGSGTHLGAYRNIAGSGDGNQFGAFNVIFNSGDGRQFGVVNQLATKGAAGHLGTFNLIGAGVLPNNPAVIHAISGDSDAKRAGNINMIAGDGGGTHIANSNIIFSTGDGTHIGDITMLGFDLENNTNTSTDGYQVGSIVNISDLGDKLHIGSVNVLGFNLDENNPFNPTPVTNDNDADRIGEINMIGGDGDGDHFTESNIVLSTGNGLHIGEVNTVGYDFNTQTATDTPGDHYGIVNTVNDKGEGRQAGVVNYIGYDYKAQEEVDGDGTHFGVVNYLYGGQNTNEGLPGVQVGTSNVILTKTDVNSFPWAGKQYGTLNIIGKDPANFFAGNTDNGDGDHFATYNEVNDLGDGDHVGTYCKVGTNGNGRHIAVFGLVEPNDVGAWAGYFQGYTSSVNQVSTVNLYSANEATVADSNFSAIEYAEAAFNPVVYSQTGLLQIKVFVRVTDYDDSEDNAFKLVALKSAGGTTVTPVSENDTWTWTETSTGKYVVETDWKEWNAGTDIWEILLQAKGLMTIDNIYIMVRPLRYNVQ